MKFLPLLVAGVCLAGGAACAQDDAAGLEAVRALAQLNGQALGCRDAAAAQRAKSLMLAHAPKTPRFAQAFDEGTQQAYLAVTRNEVACVDAASAASRLEAVAARLQAALPAGAR